MKGYIHSIQSLGTVDGPGVRSVIFTEGCPLRCIYCHNPDTWECHESNLTDSHEVAEKILRFYPYIKDGGVTFSGGVPLMQAEFLSEVAVELKEKGLHIALDTSGCDPDREKTDRLLALTDLVLLDIKMTTEDDYKKYTAGSLAEVMSFLDRLEALGKNVWIRHVVVPGINDTEEDILRLCRLISGYKCIKNVELLPFRSLCIEKYEKLGIEFPLKNTKSPTNEQMAEFREIIKSATKGSPYGRAVTEGD